jgi:hypothetical protein
MNNRWGEILSSIILCIVLFLGIFYFSDYKSKTEYKIRFFIFILIGLFLSYIMGVQYNILSSLSKDKEKTERNFFLAGAIFILLFITVIFFLPRLIEWSDAFSRLQAVLGGVLLILIIWTLISGISLLNIILSLIVFILFIIADTTVLVDRCKFRNTMDCDAPTGATQLYLDMINFIQKTFLLLEKNNSW